jgi:hypothetical protein
MADKWLEVVKQAPQFLWIAFAVLVLVVLYRPIRRAIERGDISKIGVLSVQIEFVRKELTQSQDRKGVPTPRDFKIFRDRIERSAKKIQAQRFCGLITSTQLRIFVRGVLSQLSG